MCSAAISFLVLFESWCLVGLLYRVLYLPIQTHIRFLNSQRRTNISCNLWKLQPNKIKRYGAHNDSGRFGKWLWMQNGARLYNRTKAAVCARARSRWKQKIFDLNSILLNSTQIINLYKFRSLCKWLIFQFTKVNKCQKIQTQFICVPLTCRGHNLTNGFQLNTIFKLTSLINFE